MIRALGEADDTNRRFHISFSSEAAVPRSFGMEILSHADGAVDLSRLNDSAPVLFNHDRDKVIGHVERAYIENGRGEADIVLDTDEFSSTIGSKIRSGSLRSTSVWYLPAGVDAWEELSAGQRSQDGRFAGPCSILHKWTPVELSIVTVPADPTVGVGRDESTEAAVPSIDTGTGTTEEKEGTGMADDKTRDNEREKKTQDDENERIEAHNDDREKNGDDDGDDDDDDKNEKKRGGGRSLDDGSARALEILGICRSFDLSPEEYIRSGMSIDQVRKDVMNKLCKDKAPVPSGRAQVTQDENDSKRAQIRDSILVRGGALDIKDAAPGTNRFMTKHTRDLFREAYVMEGMSRSAVDNLDDAHIFGRYMAQQTDTAGLYRAHENSTALFPAIIDDAMEKAITAGYEHLPVTYDRISTKISVRDFKEHRHLYTYGGTSRRFDRLPEGGEIKADNIQMAQLPSVHTATFAKQWAMTRELMINDDIGLVAQIPKEYGEAFRQTINDMVYDVYIKNQNAADGTPLFSGEKGHRNLLATGTTVEADAFNDMLRILQMQTDQFGERIAFKPGILLVPSALEKAAYTLFNSPTINTPDNTQASNPYYHYGVKLIVDATIDARCDSDVLPWFLFAQGTFPVEVAYLNGNEGLNRRAMQVPGQLGVIFDFYGDVDVNVTDYRQVVKNPGVKVPMKYGMAK